MNYNYCPGRAISALYADLRSGRVPYTKEQIETLDIGYFTAMLHVLQYCAHNGCDTCKTQLNEITQGEVPCGKECFGHESHTKES